MKRISNKVHWLKIQVRQMKSRSFQATCLTSVNCLLDFRQRILFMLIFNAYKQGQIYVEERWVREAELFPSLTNHRKWYHLVQSGKEEVSVWLAWSHFQLSLCHVLAPHNTKHPHVWWIPLESFHVEAFGVLNF